ncbi:bifunctional protein-disulfide isomerase/oxidoreductase DsbC [Xenorhabdus nematophila]|uniref:Thiol:disulfide interchange protein n=1 Tax=Xenorhabdus nematophila (strain ATCC 19061 / DSM 3370 / CCUG 14189 / LMG 1036 / NCIMB 9965 / AN6) TaxID=406817 RepID=D3V908_XENNA|nr:bifunctional protein-disulfide isomerase/oxidoreductase DsbC [Xenorhabdus nematophila]CEF30783.1 protein disulfide isomerase II, activated by N-terminal of DsbD [Xenorhabdus nematophila str. Websteri]AYA40835.1 bifunctional protein-disulfide isomerase/oxidoreductase DsbC [Xenorhabdus nematophila]MBA0019586.1 bifunctional protein-disulfide isomerase/oxidoreductase DsbC [Xenorhabdus nematophila]MCB4423942.1 bifunctional protein-disulfide isomerase/oxidoreductase DsbC [Xenorhabdus nematophila]
MKKIAFCFSLLLTTFASNAFADESAINNSLSKMGIKAENISPSQLSDISAILTEHGIIYMSNDGKYLLQGPLYDISGSTPKNISNQVLVKKLDALNNQMIVYKAPKEKHVVTVFTDITCGYCRKLHENMQEYNDLGITVRYLAFPRHGLQHQSAKDMQSIWCSATPNKSLNAVFKGEKVSPIKECKTDIAKQYQLGLQFGVQGTPAIVLKDGSVLGGYLPPKDLLATLEKQGE